VRSGATHAKQPTALDWYGERMRDEKGSGIDSRSTARATDDRTKHGRASVLRSLVDDASAPAARVMRSRSGAIGAAHPSGAIGAPARRRRLAPRLVGVTAPALGAQARIPRVTSQMQRGEPISLDVAKGRSCSTHGGRWRGPELLLGSRRATRPRAAPRLASSAGKAPGHRHAQALQCHGRSEDG
jgi:hypothetical protein